MTHFARRLTVMGIGIAVACALGGCTNTGGTSATDEPSRQSGPPPITTLVATSLDTSDWDLATFPDGDETRHLIRHHYTKELDDGSSMEGNPSTAIDVPALQADARFAWHISDGKSLSTALLAMPKDFPFSSALTVDLKTKAFSANDTGWIAVINKKDIPTTFSVTTADGTVHAFEVPPKARPEIVDQIVIASTSPADNPPTYGNPGE